MGELFEKNEKPLEESDTLFNKTEEALKNNLIGPVQKKYLDHMRKIRNVFSHQMAAYNFELAVALVDTRIDVEKEIMGLSDLMKGVPGIETATARRIFEMGHHFLKLSLNKGPDEFFNS